VVVYHPLLFWENESHWQVGDTTFRKVFGPTHHFLPGCTPNDSRLMVRATFPENRDSEMRSYEGLDNDGVFKAEMNVYTRQVLDVLLDSKTITPTDAKNYEEADKEIPTIRKALFVFLDESGKAKAVIRLLDHSLLPGAYGGPNLSVVPDSAYRFFWNMALVLGNPLPTHLIPLSAVASNYIPFSFEKKLIPTLPERELAFPVPMFRLERYWIAHGALESPEPLLLRVAEYLYYREGFLGNIPHGSIYATATEAGMKVYTDLRPESPYHFKTVYTPQDFRLTEGETPTYLIHQDAGEFFKRRLGGGKRPVTHHSFPNEEVFQRGVPTSFESPSSLPAAPNR